ncbi:hypothetical protein DCAR_0626071 [Daucus carota subsp. sativus]|uniref:Uncharacterized protein n=1 Tax=Daucus carota subsp. sativus TaxID=79200 RepID=A0A164WV25_DAUCS|nr:PREDICTED: 2-deoxy-glucose resistant protein 2 [Daucus carota subsp. sativus]XP_017258111.1 PREDICTED: 2-deoxy-glucose resistant protein 2 [Daucus carota subsp. sativus]WOH06643.1 hypothetical protein DCAR_0626071 [Daucus carota subsp. sativus]
MGSICTDDEEYRFFDARASSFSDSSSDNPESSCNDECGACSSYQYEVWAKGPLSVRKRRSQFLRFMGLGLDGKASGQNMVDAYDGGSFRGEIDRIKESSGAVLRNSSFKYEFCSSRSSWSSMSNDDSDLSRGLDLTENFICRAADVKHGSECDVDRIGKSTNLGNSEVIDGGQLLTCGKGQPSPSFPMVEKLVQQETEVTGNAPKMVNRVKSRWLRSLRSFSCITKKEGTVDSLRPIGSNSIVRERVQRVKVRHSKKRLKELSALFVGQDIQAHDGSILTMKFSPDGKYLASAGEDGIVRVWQVVEDKRSNEIDIPVIDPSCMYFTVNLLSELAPLMGEQEKISSKSLKKTADSACVIFPPVVFRILEKPLHEFRGHKGEILDLSWSNDNHLISSSVDETVRLWKVGCDQCLKAFPHSNFVTCVQFNPVDDNQFISGSIDGKIRIWEIDGGQVVDWTDVRDIVTAVSYRPDGQGGIIGYVTGNCRIFSVTDSHFQLEALICLNNKKKAKSKRVTGFQFFEQDPSKVLVHSADSQVKILQGINIIGKFRGPKSASNQISASFTPDGRHIISACDDSNVYFWNCSIQETSSASKPKTSRSFECFSSDASVAIPWPGLRSGISKGGCNLQVVDECVSDRLPFSPSDCFSMGQGFRVESIPKGSATWPEEKLPLSPCALPSALCKSQYKFLKTSCQSSSKTHAWGLVIVTAGWDGRIRSFHNYGLPVAL